MAISPLSVSLSLIIIQTLLLPASSSAQSPPFNISHFISPISTEVDLPPQPPPFLQDILRTASLGQGWNKSDEVRVSKLDAANARFSGSPRYEFHVRVGKTQLVFKMSDDVSKWKKMVVEKGRGFESLVKEIGLLAVIDDFWIKGPLELLTKGDNELSLHLPRNTSLVGLTRILVGEDITLEVKNAQEVSVLFALELGKNRSRGQKKGSQFWPFQHSLCESLLPVHISGSATVLAYRDRNPRSYIKTKFQSRDTVELLPEKCYTGKNYKKRQYQMESLTLRIAVMEKLLKIILGSKIYDNETFGFIRVNIRASTVVRFKIELERNIRKEDNLQGNLGEWRTKPSVECVWFDVVARIDGDRLKPLKIKKIRPFVEVDSSSLSNIMSNMSFTKLPLFLVPPEDLTLDVKW